MDAPTVLDEIQLRIILKKANSDDEDAEKAQEEYNLLIREAYNKGDKFRRLFLFYMRERVLRELLEEYIDKLP